jgi:hypothetical protein
MIDVGAVLVTTGAITAAAGVVAIAPRRALQFVFGSEPVDDQALLIARHWGLLVALVGGLLMYAAGQNAIRAAVMVVAVVEKLAIGVLVFSSPFRAKPIAAVVAAADSTMALLYVAILATARF